jgi:hypothetical protein
MVLLSLVVLSLIAVAAIQTAGHEREAGGGSLQSTKAFYAAEAGAHAVIAEWDSARYDTLAPNPGDSADLGWRILPANGAAYRPVFHRVDDGGDKLYGLTIEGGTSAQESQRKLGVLLRYSALLPNAAVTARTRIDLVTDAASIIDGNDTNPAGWVCDSAGPPVPGVMVAPGTATTIGSGTLMGDPPFTVDSTIDDSRFTQIGAFTYAELVAMADKHYPHNGTPLSFGPVVDSLGACDTSVQDNWGDPLNPGSPCSDYFPIIHFEGDTQFLYTSGSAGQGILLIDGELDVNPGGGFTFYGLVVTQGPCQVERSTTVYGAVLCSNPAGQTQQIHYDSFVRYSRCALKKAMGIGNEGVAVVQGSWKELTQ